MLVDVSWLVGYKLNLMILKKTKTREKKRTETASTQAV